MSWETVQQLLVGQGGLVTRRQALDVGVAPSAIDRQRRLGRWRRVLPGVYVVGEGELTVQQREQAALLYAGPGAALTAATAARHHGLLYAADDGRVHVAVDHERRRASTGFVCLHRRRHDDPVERTAGGLRVVGCAEAVAAFGVESADLRAVRAVVLEAVQRARLSVEELAAAVARSPRRGSTLVRRALTDARAGVRSAPEAELRDLLVSASDLPTARFNADVRAEDGTWLARVDVLWPAARVVVEVDSLEWHHSDADQVDATDARHNRLEQHGYAVLHFTPRAIRSNPQRVLAAIRATLITRSLVPLATA